MNIRLNIECHHYNRHFKDFLFNFAIAQKLNNIIKKKGLNNEAPKK